MFRFLIFTFVSFVALDLAAQKDASKEKSKLDSLSWLAGHWESDRNGRVTEEIWMAPKGGLMVGINRSVSGTSRASFEFLRIQVVGDKIIYYASPGGSKPTPFTLTSSKDNSAVFENPEHDFPQRIVYRLKDEQLVARIEGNINGEERAMEWKWNAKN